MNVVSTMSTKDERIYIRLASDIKEEFGKVAEMRGLSTSALLHSLIVKTIREEKMNFPESFSNGGFDEAKMADVETFENVEDKTQKKKTG